MRCVAHDWVHEPNNDVEIIRDHIHPGMDEAEDMTLPEAYAPLRRSSHQPCSHRTGNAGYCGRCAHSRALLAYRMLAKRNFVLRSG